VSVEMAGISWTGRDPKWDVSAETSRCASGVRWLRGKRSARICLHAVRSHDSSVTTGATQRASRRTESTRTEISRSRTCPTTSTRSTIVSGPAAIWVVSALKSSKSVRSSLGWRVREILGTPEEQDNHGRLTEKGRFFSDEISLCFNSQSVRSILEKAGMRHGMFFEAGKHV
jgi:hypothetical protein